MYPKNLGSYIRAGLLAALLISIVSLAVYYILGAVAGHDTSFIGQEKDRLYAGFVVFSTLIACIVGAIAFYFIQKSSSKPILYLGLLIVIGLALNTLAASTALHNDYELTAHVLHIIVASAAFILLPRLVRAS